MQILYDVQQLLKKYGCYIYTGKRLYDIELMEMELEDLNKAQILSDEDYQAAYNVLKKEYELEIKNSDEE